MQRSFFLLLLLAAFTLASCNALKPKYGCPSDGRNVGAEKLLNEQPKKTKKFKA